jgi:hypothetical protein
VLVLTDAVDLAALAAYRPDGWRSLVLEVAARGVTVTR